IMVGAFGEVQVMDWGLAKQISDFKFQNADLQESPPKILSENLQYEISNLQSTQAGTVLGTPAYMAPEQACGAVDTLDERADVFGLGAILCEILTSKPPFEGKEAYDQSRRGDLSVAWRRLEACGADAELVA